MRRTVLAALTVSAVIGLAACSGGGADDSDREPAQTSAPAQTSGAPNEADNEPAGGGDGVAFPCDLVDVALVEALIDEPRYDPELAAVARGEAACGWLSVTNPGDEVVLVWMPTDFTQAQPASEPVRGLGDEAFSLTIRTNVANNTRTVVQNRLFVEFEDRRFMLRVRSELPNRADMESLAVSLIDQCGAECGPPRPDASTPPALADSACALLSDSEVESITGVAAAGEAGKSDGGGCNWDYKVTILEVDADRWDEFQQLDEVVPVTGVGEAAFYRREQLIFTQSGQYWSVMSTAGGSRDESLRQTSALGSLLAARL